MQRRTERRMSDSSMPVFDSPRKRAAAAAAAAAASLRAAQVPRRAPSRLWTLLRASLASEAAAGDAEDAEAKVARLHGNVTVPLRVEQLVGFCALLCFNTFVGAIARIPLRFIGAVAGATPSAARADLLRGLLLIVSVVAVVALVDESQIYHTIRGQTSLKLYVIFNVLEVSLSLSYFFVLVYEQLRGRSSTGS